MTPITYDRDYRESLAEANIPAADFDDVEHELLCSTREAGLTSPFALDDDGR